MTRLVLVVTAGLLLLVLGCGALLAQSTNGTITGRITDPSKATIAGAKVLMINVNTNSTQNTASDNAGSYHLTN